MKKAIKVAVAAEKKRSSQALAAIEAELDTAREDQKKLKLITNNCHLFDQQGKKGVSFPTAWQFLAMDWMSHGVDATQAAHLFKSAVKVLRPDMVEYKTPGERFVRHCNAAMFTIASLVGAIKFFKATSFVLTMDLSSLNQQEFGVAIARVTNPDGSVEEAPKHIAQHGSLALFLSLSLSLSRHFAVRNTSKSLAHTIKFGPMQPRSTQLP